MFNNTTHWSLQGKGGVGKSFLATILTQYLKARSQEPVCADTDPVNSTFHQMKALDVALVPITDGGTVVQRLFDPLFETILTTEAVTVVDNGASTFLPMIKFISSNDILTTMQEFKKKVFIHCVVTGGQAKDDTVTGLLSLIDMVNDSKTDTKIVVWQNEFQGIPEFDGTAMVDMPWFRKGGDVIQGLVTIVDRNSDAFSTDIRIMSEKHLTLSEVMQSTEFGTLAKSRLKRVFNDIFEDLDRVFGISPGS